MERAEIQSLDRVMSFKNVLSAVTEIARADSRIFLRTLLIYVGPLELLRMILEIGFRYTQYYNSSSILQDNFYFTTEGFISILCSAIIMAVQIVIAFGIASQYAGDRKLVSKISDLVKVRNGLGLSFAGLMLIQILISAAIVGFMMLIVTNSDMPLLISFFTVIAAFFALFYFYTSFSMSGFVMLGENTSLGKSIERSFALANGNRWFIFGLVIVICIMIYLVVVGMMLLSGIIIGLSKVSGQSLIANQFFLVAAIRVFSGVITLFGSGLLMLVLAVQYFNLRERLDATQLEKRVNEIGNIE
jgi:hypothetical protein